MILREAEAEFKRRGRFSLIYPANGTSCYRPYFEEVRPLNTLLYKRCIEKNLFSQLRQQERQTETVGRRIKSQSSSQEPIERGFKHADELSHVD